MSDAVQRVSEESLLRAMGRAGLFYAGGLYDQPPSLRDRLFESLVKRAARALAQEVIRNDWYSAVFDTCQKVAVRDLGFTDVEFLQAVEREVKTCETQ